MGGMGIPRRVWPLLLASMIVAICGFLGLRILIHHTVDLRLVADLSYGLAGIWIVLLCVGLFCYRKHGLWLLVGAPFALFYAYAIWMWFWACAHNVNACP